VRTVRVSFTQNASPARDDPLRHCSQRRIYRFNSGSGDVAARPINRGFRSLQQAEGFGTSDRLGPGVHSELAVERVLVGVDGAVGEKELLADLPRRQVAAEETENLELGLGGRFEDVPVSRTVLRRRQLTLCLRRQLRKTSAVREVVERLPSGLERLLGLAEATALDADTGKKHEQPGLVHRRDLVVEEVVSRSLLRG
jgi:hypothetical protein